MGTTEKDEGDYEARELGDDLLDGLAGGAQAKKSGHDDGKPGGGSAKGGHQ